MLFLCFAVPITIITISVVRNVYYLRLRSKRELSQYNDYP